MSKILSVRRRRKRCHGTQQDQGTVGGREEDLLVFPHQAFGNRQLGSRELAHQGPRIVGDHCSFGDRKVRFGGKTKASGLRFERIEGKTEATAQTQSLEEGSRPRGFDWQVPSKT